MYETIVPPGMYEAAFRKPQQPADPPLDRFTALFGPPTLGPTKTGTITVTVRYDPEVLSLDQVAERVRERLRKSEGVPVPPPKRNPVLDAIFGSSPFPHPKWRFSWRVLQTHAWGSEDYVQ